MKTVLQGNLFHSVYVSALFAVALMVVGILSGCARTPFDQNLITNSDLTEGYGGEPFGWTRGSNRYLEQTQGNGDFGWIHPPGASGELVLSAHEINVVDWDQTITLAPGTYHLTGEMWMNDADSLRGAGIDFRFGNNTLGLAGFDSSLPSDWKKGVLFFKAGKPRKVEVDCKLIGRSNKTRTAYFRHLSLIRMSGSPPAGGTVIDIDTYGDTSLDRKFHASREAFMQPVGDPWTIIATLLLLSAIAIYGWVLLGVAAKNSGPLRKAS
jgi:hypothetical protein